MSLDLLVFAMELTHHVLEFIHVSQDTGNELVLHADHAINYHRVLLTYMLPLTYPIFTHYNENDIFLKYLVGTHHLVDLFNKRNRFPPSHLEILTVRLHVLVVRVVQLSALIHHTRCNGE